VLFCVLFVCKCVLPPGDNSTAVNKYIISYFLLLKTKIGYQSLHWIKLAQDRVQWPGFYERHDAPLKFQKRKAGRDGAAFLYHLGNHTLSKVRLCTMQLACQFWWSSAYMLHWKWSHPDDSRSWFLSFLLKNCLHFNPLLGPSQRVKHAYTTKRTFRFHSPSSIINAVYLILYPL